MSREALDDLFGGYPAAMNPEQVAEVLTMTKAGVYRWLKDGTIPGYKVGSTWRIIRDELKTTLEAGSNRPDGHVDSVHELDEDAPED